jgi:hypothetical protein
MTILASVNNKSVMPGITPISDVPDAPIIGTATAVSDVSATVAYTAATTGGTGSTFTATSTPGSVTATGSSPITVTGLTGSTAYTFTVRSSNSTGASPLSAASNSITTLESTKYDSIQTVTLSSAQNVVTFSSIPSTYKHLQVRYLARTSRAEGAEDLMMQFNSDTGSNYSFHYFLGTGSGTPAVSGAGTQTFMYIPSVPASTAIANSFGAGIVDILDYANTDKYKTMRVLGGEERNGSGTISFESGSWRNTNAISTVTLKTINSNNFVQHSSFALYGIK